MIKKNLLFLWGTALLPLLLVLAFYGRLPDTIPTQFQNGTVGYGPRATIWLLAGLPFVCSAIFTIAPKVDPRRRNYRRFQGAYNLFASVLNLFLLLITGVIISESLRPGWAAGGPVGDRLAGGAVCRHGQLHAQNRQQLYVRHTHHVDHRKRRGMAAHQPAGRQTVVLRRHFGGVSGTAAPVRHVSLVLRHPRHGHTGILPVLYSFLLYRKLQRPDGPLRSR